MKSLKYLSELIAKYGDNLTLVIERLSERISSPFAVGEMQLFFRVFLLGKNMGFFTCTVDNFFKYIDKGIGVVLLEKSIISYYDKVISSTDDVNKKQFWICQREC